jgi:hypothetical protein
MAFVFVARGVGDLEPGQDRLTASPLVAVLNEPLHNIRHEPLHNIRHDQMRKYLPLIVLQVLRQHREQLSMLKAERANESNRAGRRGVSLRWPTGHVATISTHIALASRGWLIPSRWLGHVRGGSSGPQRS